jgi:hypothetical protein
MLFRAPPTLRLDELETILVPPDVSREDAVVARTRGAWSAAKQAVVEAQAAFEEAAKIHGTALGMFPEHREVAAARAAFATAEKAMREAARAHGQAREYREAAFVQAQAKALAAAGPLLEELAEIAFRGIAALTELHSDAWRRGMPVHQSLQAVPVMQQGALALRALANRFAAPSEND